MIDRTGEAICFYWGCWGAAGHFLHNHSKHTLRDGLETKWFNVPTDHQLDATGIFLPREERHGDGCLTYLPAMDLQVLAWWGNNPWDTRGAVNQAILLREPGRPKWTFDQLWARFEIYYPELSKQLPKPRDTAVVPPQEPGEPPRCGDFAREAAARFKSIFPMLNHAKGGVVISPQLDEVMEGWMANAFDAGARRSDWYHNRKP